MTIELIVFIASIVFGVLLYWRESNGNGLYRALNKIVNSKELQMKNHERRGFIYQQKFLLRLVYIVVLFLIIALVFQFLTPFQIFGSYNGISTFASSIVGTLIGTYLANFIIKSGHVIENKSDVVEDLVNDVVEKGKDIIDDFTSEDKTEKNNSPEALKSKPEHTPQKDEKTARERLKDKGLL